MKVRPIQISLFILFILGALFGLMFLSEKGAVKKAQKQDDGFSYEGVSVKYPTHTTFLGLEKDSSLTRQDILKVTEIVTPLEIETEENKTAVSINNDTKNDKLQLPDFSKIDTTQLERIRYPESNPEFVNELRNKLSSRSCRILHYGDSQIEGDRITAYLRNRLQRMYGGSGPGFIPVKPVYRQISAIVEPSENWERYAFFDPTKKKFSHKKYGAYLSVSRFTPHQSKIPDSTALDSLPIVKATIKVGKSKKSFAKFRTFTNIGLHYGNANTPIKISVYNDGTLIKQDSLIADGKYHRYKIKTTSTPTDLRIELEGKISADFYGLTLDGGSRVQIDNIAMRGASGTIFANSNGATYGRMVRQLNPKIVIMQYGGNTMPYLKDSTDVDKYTARIARQINWIRRRAKKSSFIFIGPTDMCQPVNGKMETYPMLPYLNTKLMETCLENNVAYWSMFDAMGGKGSMELWVEEKMTAKDYMHFTWKGTKIISELFFTALYLDLKEPDENET
ncbi:lipase [Aquimarina sp. 2201CG5-10]|uniref:lipase n=1 Tax=Aquimarina callyspongiae TaxID=3098150 RepID=UPI002AB48F7A|nr:lipase [Aquimarina sp. 2201CG5-10]MDY8134201.1 lipase [Aquimarina sp. 2201CG5-10]